MKATLMFVIVNLSYLLIIQSNPLNSVLCLILITFSFSFLLLLCGLEFLPLVLIIVYLGAVIVLFLFVVMMINFEFNISPNNRVEGLGLSFQFLLSIFFLAWLTVLFLNYFYFLYSFFFINYFDLSLVYIDYFQLFSTSTDVVKLSLLLYNFYYFNLFLASIILLVSIIGCIVLTTPRFLREKDRIIFSQVEADYYSSVRLHNVDL